jgi:hypothetical protein
VSGPKVSSTYPCSGNWQCPEPCVQVLGKHLPYLPDKDKETVKNISAENARSLKSFLPEAPTSGPSGLSTHGT